MTLHRFFAPAVGSGVRCDKVRVMPDRRPAVRSAVAPARIVVVDDHPIVRLGIRRMIDAEADLSVVAEGDSAEAALQQVSRGQLDLLIIDFTLRDGGGLDLIKTLRERAPSLSVLVLSMHDEAMFAERVLRAGARGYVMKQEALTTLVGAIRQVLAGDLYLSPNMAQRLLARLGPDGVSLRSGVEALTDRELEVFEMIGRGLSTAAIAHQLHVSIKTVETHRGNIRSKLELKDASELLRYASSWLERH
jgi:DNA-binding NarL/FixJ family response regulator